MAADSTYNKALADYAVNFIECLCHTKGTWAGKPFELIDWQERIIRDIFGTIKPNGYRQFTTAYVEIPKKMGKSELAAAVALLLTCGDGEERAEVYGCAADRQQATIVFDVAADMVRMCPALNRRVKILASQKRIVYTPTNSFYQVLSAEAYSKHGFNIHGVVFDELHTQPNRKLFDVMTKGSGDARMQPLYFLITTAGTDTNSICYETHQKAKDILEGRKIDPTFYPVIYGADESDDWTDPEVWKKANPSLGITVGIDKVQAACESAQQNPAEENAFRQLRLNQWVKQAVRWMPMDKWDACAFKVNEESLRGRVCYGGLDLSSTTDITAFVLVFPPLDEDDKYVVLPYFWIPEDTLELRARRDHVPYDVWERQGFLQTTEGNVVHYGYIEKFIEQLGEKYNIREIAFDRWGAVQMVQNLEGMGFTVVPFGQGFKDMSPPKAAYFIKFNVDGLLRGDYQSRMNGYAIGRQNGWMSANDIRELENLDRIPAEEGGDLYLINGNMTKLKDAGIFAGKEETQNEEVLELEDPDGDQSGDSGDGDGENAVPQRNNRRGKLV